MGESPIASHLLYTQVLDDNRPEERRQGIAAGLAWRIAAHKVVAYIDRGITPGMAAAIAKAQQAGMPIVYRSILPTLALLRKNSKSYRHAG